MDNTILSMHPVYAAEWQAAQRAQPWWKRLLDRIRGRKNPWILGDM